MAASVSHGKIEVFGVKQAFSVYCHTQQPARMHRALLTHPSELSETEICGHTQKLLRMCTSFCLIKSFEEQIKKKVITLLRTVIVSIY